MSLITIYMINKFYFSLTCVLWYLYKYDLLSILYLYFHISDGSLEEDKTLLDTCFQIRGAGGPEFLRFIFFLSFVYFSFLDEFSFYFLGDVYFIFLVHSPKRCRQASIQNK